MKRWIGIALAVTLIGAYFWPVPQPVAVENIPVALEHDTALVYFGTKDCGSCQGFVRNDIRTVEQNARKDGYTFVRREISSLRDLGRDGAFGSWDTLHQAAVRMAGHNAVPMFAVVRDGKLVAARAGDWMKMSERAASLVRGG